MRREIFTKKHQLGLGSVAIGTAFENVTDEQAYKILNTASDSGIGYYDIALLRTYQKREAIRGISSG